MYYFINICSTQIVWQLLGWEGEWEEAIAKEGKLKRVKSIAKGKE